MVPSPERRAASNGAAHSVSGAPSVRSFAGSGRRAGHDRLRNGPRGAGRRRAPSTALGYPESPCPGREPGVDGGEHVDIVTDFRAGGSGRAVYLDDTRLEIRDNLWVVP
jgi:hypothetical protein